MKDEYKDACPTCHNKGRITPCPDCVDKKSDADLDRELRVSNPTKEQKIDYWRHRLSVAERHVRDVEKIIEELKG